MDKICTISDDESDTSGDQEGTEHVNVNQEAAVSHSEKFLHVRQPSRGELTARNRNLSINEEDFQEATDGKSGAAAGDGDAFRRRTHSAPPAFWAAKKYGRELRRMSDEFDTLLDKGMKRVRSAGAAGQMRTSPAGSNSSGATKSQTETMNSLTAQNTRPAE